MTKTLTTEAYETDIETGAEGILDWFDADAPADDDGSLRDNHEKNVRDALANEWFAGRDYDEWVRAASERVGVAIP